MSEKRLPVLRCARCGDNHDEIVYKKFHRPIEDEDGTVWNWWGTCPVTGDPILMRFATSWGDEDEQQSPNEGDK